MDAFDLQRQKFLRPWAQGVRSLQTLLVDLGVNAASQLLVGDPDESPWLHQADIGCGVGGLQQAGQNILGNLAAGHESAHVTTFGDHAIDRLPLPRTECVITHIAIVGTVGCGSDQ